MEHIVRLDREAILADIYLDFLQSTRAGLEADQTQLPLWEAVGMSKHIMYQYLNSVPRKMCTCQLRCTKIVHALCGLQVRVEYVQSMHTVRNMVCVCKKAKENKMKLKLNGLCPL